MLTNFFFVDDNGNPDGGFVFLFTSLNRDQYLYFKYKFKTKFALYQ